MSTFRLCRFVGGPNDGHERVVRDDKNLLFASDKPKAKADRTTGPAYLRRGDEAVFEFLGWKTREQIIAEYSEPPDEADRWKQ